MLGRAYLSFVLPIVAGALGLVGCAGSKGVLRAYRPEAPPGPNNDLVAPSAIVFRAVKSRAPIMELRAVASQDLRLRRIAFVGAEDPPCSQAAPSVIVDGVTTSTQTGELAVTRGKTIDIELSPAADWPSRPGPKVLDLQLVRAGGAGCSRVPVTGREPNQTWVTDTRWALVVRVDLGEGVQASTSRPIEMGWGFNTVLSVERWWGRFRVDLGGLWGKIGCDSGCGEAGRFTELGGRASAGMIAWQWRRVALELGAGYSLTHAENAVASFPMQGARIGVLVGVCCTSVVGFKESSRDGTMGFEGFVDWRFPLDDRVRRASMIGAGFVLRHP